MDATPIDGPAEPDRRLPGAGGAPRPRRGRPRDPGADRAIADAVVDLLSERGVRGVTIDGIAARSGVARTTVSRRFASSDDALFAVIDRLNAEIPDPDTGSVRADLVHLVMTSIAVLSRPRERRFVVELLAAEAGDPELAAAVQAQWAQRRARTGAVVRRGVDRGELRADVDADVVLDLLAGIVYFRSLVRYAPLDRELAERAVDTVLLAASGR